MFRRSLATDGKYTFPLVYYLSISSYNSIYVKCVKGRDRVAGTIIVNLKLWVGNIFKISQCQSDL